MKYVYFKISAIFPDAGADKLNALISNNAVTSICEKFVDDGQNSFWSVRVAFVKDLAKSSVDNTNPSKRVSGDYRELLNLEEFAIYCKLRALINNIAEQQGKINDTQLQKGQNRVLRGGSWNNNGRNLRSANRNANEPDNRHHNYGFRLAGALLAGGSINQQHYLFRERLNSLNGQIQDLRCVSQLFAQSLPLGRFLK